MAENQDHDELISSFVSLTNSSPSDAQQHLATNHWDLQAAVTEYFTALDEGTERAQAGGEDDPQEAEAYTGPRTLDGRPAPASTLASASRAPPKKKGIATLGSAGEGSDDHGHAHDDDDDSDDGDFQPDEEPRDLFAGGEKSGLAVQDPRRNDPRKVVKDILKKAKANTPRPGGESSTAPPSRFHGSGQTLGGDDTPSQTIPDANPRAAAAVEPQSRILNLWEDGFSIDDGELRRFDDPQNAADLEMIRRGRAPLHLMGVRPDQPVDVQLVKHDEKYKAQPKKYKPFSGGGQRLGSPVPGVSSVAAPAPAAAAPAASTPTAPTPEIDASQPTLNLRIQLANGSRLPARFNTTQTIGDVYNFVQGASPDSNSRPWVLATTFPNKDHTDKTLVLGEMAEFKRGGNVVQKWS